VSTARVTVVVVPRERFSCSARSLEGIFQNTAAPFDLVYVDGGSPRRVRRYLREQAERRDFRLIRRDRYLSPNEARNIGLAEVTSEYVVFIDNDVSVTPGWLDMLVRCADEEDAAVVGPLTLFGPLEHEEIHLAGGEVSILEDGDGRRRRHVKEKMYFPGRRVSDVRHQLTRSECRLAEFHCLLARKDVFERVGPFDEAMLNTREHLDFSLAVMETGGTIWFEPESLVTYIPGPPFKPTDIPFFMLRWSDAWERSSLRRFHEKWNLTEDEFFERRYARLGWRRQRSLVRPLVRWLTLGRGSHKVERAVMRVERVFNRYLTTRHARGTASA
jgi:GT2 family glycosyltransferase